MRAAVSVPMLCHSLPRLHVPTAASLHSSLLHAPPPPPRFFASHSIQVVHSFSFSSICVVGDIHVRVGPERRGLPRNTPHRQQVRSIKGGWSLYTYAKETLGCCESNCLVFACARPVLVACATIRKHLAMDNGGNNDNDNLCDIWHCCFNSLVDF